MICLARVTDQRFVSTLSTSSIHSWPKLSVQPNTSISYKQRPLARNSHHTTFLLNFDYHQLPVSHC
jgi:hypothetical protein